MSEIFKFGEQENNPEKDKLHLAKALWEEVRLADRILRGVTMIGDPIPPNEIWDHAEPKQMQLAYSLGYARSILQGFGGSPHWRLTFMPRIVMDKAAFDIPDGDQKNQRMENTHLLLDLIVLSRTEPKPHLGDESRMLPQKWDMQAEAGVMCQELGLADEYDRLMNEPGRRVSYLPPTFPGLNDELLVQAVAEEQLRVGFAI